MSSGQTLISGQLADMQSFAPSSTSMFLSLGRRADGSASPGKDAFREVFRGSLQARKTSRPAASEESAAQSSGAKKSLAKDRGGVVGKKGATVVRRSANRPEKNAWAEVDNPGSFQGSTSTPKTMRREAAPESGWQAAAAAKPKRGGGAGPQGGDVPKASPGLPPPPALQELMAFLQTQPDGALKISPEQAPVLADLLRSVGLPQEEVGLLVAAATSPEKGLTAGDLSAAWERLQSQAAAPKTPEVSPQKGMAEGLQPTQKSNPTQGDEDIRRTSDYRDLWDRLTVPPDRIPTLRLALARLGGTPEELAKLEGETQGSGISLSRAWQVLRASLHSPATNQTGSQSHPTPGEVFSQSAILDAKPVTSDQLAEWQQVLTQAGLQPELVQKLLGQATPTTHQELKTALLSLAPPEETTVLSAPKPLYLPDNLRQQPFFFQGQSQDEQPQFLGNRGGEQQPWGAMAAAATLPSAATGEGVGLGAFFPELQMFSHMGGGTAAPLSSQNPGWRLLSPEMRESLWSQIQSGITANLQAGESQISLNLNPPELGQIQLNLRLSGQELAVVAVATRPEVAELAAQGVQQLLQSLAQQGLLLTQFQVRLQDQPASQAAPVFAGTRGKSGESGEKFPPPSRRRSGEVDRFV
jgi:flagellar hook-length control protein FliK